MASRLLLFLSHGTAAFWLVNKFQWVSSAFYSPSAFLGKHWSKSCSQEPGVIYALAFIPYITVNGDNRCQKATEFIHFILETLLSVEHSGILTQ